MRVASSCILALMLFCSPAWAAKAEREYKFGLAMAEGHHLVMGAQKISELIGKYTDGRLTSHVYTAGQIASGERELVEGLQFGTVDLTLVAAAMLGPYDERFQMLNLHYLFRDEEHAYKTMDGPIGKALADIINKNQDMVLIGWSMSGVHTVTNSKRAINTVDDMKGLKIRCMETPIIADAWRSYGAVPTPMSVSETFTAMQQGTVDGQDGGTANSYANKFGEVQKHLAPTNHMVSLAVVLMSKAQYEAVPADIKEAFDRAVADGIKWQREEYARQNAAALENFKKQGLAISSPDLAGFRKAAEGVRAEYLKKMDPQVSQWVEEIQTKY